MNLIEQALREKIFNLRQELRMFEWELRKLQADTPPDGSPSIKPRRVSALVREAVEVAPTEFSSSFVRDYVLQRKPEAKPGTIKSAISIYVPKLATRLERGKCGKPSTYEKNPSDLKETA